MKPTFGVGMVVVVLITASVALLGVVTLQGALSMLLLLAGLWSVLAAFSIVGGKDRAFYAGWGIIFAGLSLSYFVPVQDALAVVLLAIVGLLVVTAYTARSPKGVASIPSSGTPAAT